MLYKWSGEQLLAAALVDQELLDATVATNAMSVDVTSSAESGAAI